MAKRKLRWGLLSTARINRAVIPPIRESDRNELVGVASRAWQVAEGFAREWKIPRVYGSYEALLEDPEIDVIYNPLPNALHAEWTIRACQAGKHVLCEKPLAMTVEEVDAMEAAARENGVTIAEAFMYRYHPQTLKIVEMVEQGAIGELQVIKGTFTFTLDRPKDVRWDPALGGGSIWDVGCYPISYARLIAGREPESVFGWQTTSPSGVDETFTGQMIFPGGVMAQFHSGFCSPYRVWMEIAGSKGYIYIPTPFGPEHGERIILHRGDETQELESPGQDRYLGEIEDMADVILEGKPPRVSLDDSRGNVASIQALLRSAKEIIPISIVGK